NENKLLSLQLELDPPAAREDTRPPDKNSQLPTLNFKLLPPPPGFFASYKVHEFILSCFGLYQINLKTA
ncbi:MAG: hypothetical protein IKC27_04830, partial [Kiritimatiellae bacterium]|nr:hypothetical protein [Kiritimatiellia bacterium]